SCDGSGLQPNGCARLHSWRLRVPVLKCRPGPRGAEQGGNSRLSSNYWLRNRLSRRNLLRSSGFVGAGLAGAALIGCGGDDDNGGNGGNGGDPTGTPVRNVTNTPTTGEAKPGGTYRTSLVGEPPTLDPYRNAAVSTKNFANHIYS